MNCGHSSDLVVYWGNEPRCLMCEHQELKEKLAAAEALLCHAADGQFYGCGSKVFYRDPTGYIQGLDVGVMFRTDSSVPEIVYHPYPVFSSHEAAAKGKLE